MPKVAGPVLRKVTLNLYNADVEWYQLNFGPGWSTQIREILHQYRIELKRFDDLEEGDF